MANDLTPKPSGLALIAAWTRYISARIWRRLKRYGAGDGPAAELRRARLNVLVSTFLLSLIATVALVIVSVQQLIPSWLTTDAFKVLVPTAISISTTLVAFSTVETWLQIRERRLIENTYGSFHKLLGSARGAPRRLIVVLPEFDNSKASITRAEFLDIRASGKHMGSVVPDNVRTPTEATKAGQFISMGAFGDIRAAAAIIASLGEMDLPAPEIMSDRDYLTMLNRDASSQDLRNVTTISIGLFSNRVTLGLLNKSPLVNAIRVAQEWVEFDDEVTPSVGSTDEAPQSTTEATQGADRTQRGAASTSGLGKSPDDESFSERAARIGHIVVGKAPLRGNTRQIQESNSASGLRENNHHWKHKAHFCRSLTGDDFALVIRTRESNGTSFIVAGLSELGTTAAGRYFQEKWRAIMDDGVMDPVTKGHVALETEQDRLLFVLRVQKECVSELVLAANLTNEARER